MSEQWEVTGRHPGAGATVVDVWRHRWLLRYIGDRALRKVYRRTVLGWLWLFINPLFPLLLRVLVFGLLLGAGSDGLPYLLFLLTGTIVWDAFASSVVRGTRALEMNRDLTNLISYPRAILPFGNISPSLLDLAIKLAVFAAVIGFYAVRDGRTYLRDDLALLWAVAALALAFLFALAISFFTSVWGETARDARFALTQLTAVWYLLTPVVYPLSQVPEQYRPWMLLNPMAIITETFRWGLFGIGTFDPRLFGTTAAAVLLLLFGGLVYFTRIEARTIEDR